MPDPPYPIRATEIAQYVRHHGCERRLRLEYNDREATDELPFAERLFNALDPVLQMKGEQREDEWAAALVDEDVQEADPEGDDDAGDIPLAASDNEAQNDLNNDGTINWAQLETLLSDTSPNEPSFAREVAIEGQIGVFQVSGRVDFAILRSEEGNRRLRIVETKSSRKDRTNQRIQVAAYKLLIEQQLAENHLFVPGGIVEPSDVEYVVGRIDESTNQIQDILELEPLDLSSVTSDVEELLCAGGTFERIVTTDVGNVDELDYQLNLKCDQCVFDVHCFPETARHRSLELLGIDPTTVRALEDQGIETLDDLGQLDPRSPEAAVLRRNRSVREDVQDLRDRAGARLQTLPEGEEEPDAYPVQQLESHGESRLPEHQIDGDHVVRVYFSVDYDYTEDRVAGLAAHVTRSDWEIETPVEYEETDDGWDRDTSPEVVEVPPPNGDEPEDAERAVRGESVVSLQPVEWSGDYDRDTASETNLIHNFLEDLIDAITIVAENDQEFVHFYVWSRSEMDHLIEAASRAGTRLLTRLRELLGCREPLEQMIYSSLRDEVDSRYALGWTGRGLAVATSLRWFGDEYHWDRQVAGETVELDRVFEQDVFDFKSTLGMMDDGSWAPRDSEPDETHRFEIRSRFFDSLPMAYMHVVWGGLPEPEAHNDPRMVSQLRRYHQADRLKLRAYQEARVQALRWVDEHIRFHNDEIAKSRLTIDDLRDFELDVEGAVRAAIDFLLLDHHVGLTDWFAENMQPTGHRITQGEALPLRNGVWQGGTDLEAELDFDRVDIDAEEYRLRTSFDEGSFTRVSPTSDDPQRGPTYRQLSRGRSIFVIEDLDWDTETISLSGIPSEETRYKLRSTPFGDAGEDHFADTLLLTESITDFAAPRVHDRLESGKGVHALRWLDSETPAVPPSPALEDDRRAQYERLLEAIEVGDGDRLQDSQIEAILDGLDTRLHLVHGPPGTGKTTVTAYAVLLRILDHLNSGDTILLGGNTHRAVDNLLARIGEYADSFSELADRLGFEMPELTLVKADSSGENGPDNVEVITAGGSNIRQLDRYRDEGVLLIGGTVSSVIKQVEKLDSSRTFGGDNNEFHADELVVDEASMLVFPHFLALSTTVDREGRILLAGDHRQLSPIVAHEWDEEDRPPVELYKPYSSAFEAIQDLGDHEDMGQDSIRLSRLQYTFRLPPVIRALVSQLYEAYDDTRLGGREPEEVGVPLDRADDPLSAIWEQDTGLFLMSHSERESRVSNPFEAQLIQQLLDQDEAGELEDNSVAVLTPHTAQRSHLQEILADELDGCVEVVDTVERLQGGECENIIVSATASDPTGIGSNEDFLLDLNRSNVAFSRTEQRLIVICAESFLNHIPPEIEDYNAAMLWKSLRSLCSAEIGATEFDGHQISVNAPDPNEIRDLLEDG